MNLSWPPHTQRFIPARCPPVRIVTEDFGITVLLSVIAERKTAVANSVQTSPLRTDLKLLEFHPLDVRPRPDEWADG